MCAHGCVCSFTGPSHASYNRSTVTVSVQGAILLGPRFDRVKDGKFITINGHHKPMAFLGAIVLWVGWFAFNSVPSFALEPERQTAVLGRTVRSFAPGCCAVLVSCFILSLCIARVNAD